MRAATDAATQLVELQQPEPVGVLDHHHRRVGHVDAHLDHGRRHQHVDLAGAERGHRRLLLGRRHLAVQQAEPQPGELLGAQPLELLGGRTRLELVRPLDERAHHVRLAARFDLGAHLLVHRTRSRGPPPTTVVSIGERPAGSSRSSVLSRSP